MQGRPRSSAQYLDIGIIFLVGTVVSCNVIFSLGFVLSLGQIQPD
jgi:hypothetical protein